MFQHSPRHLFVLFALAIPLALVPAPASAATSAPTHQEVRPLAMADANPRTAPKVQTSEGKTAPAPAAPKAATSASGGLKREVFGFARSGSLSDPNLGYAAWDFSLISTVAYFGVNVNGDGTLNSADLTSSDYTSSLPALVSTAHSHGVKVVLSIILQDFSSGQSAMCSGLMNGSTTVSKTAAQVTATHTDGVNLDYEGYNATCSNGQTTRSMLTGFVQKMRSGLPAGSYLSIDTYGSSAGDSAGFFDIPGIAPNVDSIFVMAYDLDYSNSHSPPLNCSGYCLSPVSPIGGYAWNDTRITQQYLSVVPASKVILGLPYYGRKACVFSATQPNQAPYPAPDGSTHLTGSPYTDASTVPSTPGVNTYSGTQRDANDPAGNEPWATWWYTPYSCWREQYWDDPVSLANKYNLVNSYGLRGAGIFTLDYGGGSPELWSTLRTYFSSPPWFASYDVHNTPTTWQAGQTQTFSATFTNGGSNTWPAGGTDPVHIGVHFSTQGGGEAVDFSSWLSDQRLSLPNDVGPGQSVTMNIGVTAPPSAGGSLTVEFQAVKENEFWFSNYADVAVTSSQATYPFATPAGWGSGQSASFTVTLTNTGAWTWPAGGPNPVRLGVHFTPQPGGEQVNYSSWLSDQRFWLPVNVSPGQTISFTVQVTAPISAGNGLYVEYQLVSENQFWFRQFSDQHVNVAQAGYDISQAPSSWQAGQTQTYTVTLINTGQWTWPAGGSNPVRLGVRFTTQPGGERMNFPDWLSDQRYSLPSDVVPGQRLPLTISVTAPLDAAGTVTVEYQLVKEGQFWFGDYADQQVTMADGSYSVGNTPATWAAGQAANYAVTLTNSGTWTWPAGGSNPVRLGVHFTTQAGGEATNFASWLSDQRFSLPSDLAPSQSVTFNIAVVAPVNASGNLTLEYQLVKEGQFWFQAFADVSVTVSEATYATASAPSTLVSGQQSGVFQVTLTNTGAWTWPAGGSNPVRLGVHLAGAGGGEAVNVSQWLTDQRFSLPADVAPGQSVTLNISVTPPPRAGGSLVLEYQLVEEGAFWFASFSDQSVTVTQVSYNVTATPTAWTKGQFQTYQVTVTNTGGWTWPAAGNNPVHLGIHFTTAGGGEAVDYASWVTDQRFVLPADVPPGGSATITVYVSAPNNSGSMFIEYQMVSENQFWFGQFQDVSVTVS